LDEEVVDLAHCCHELIEVDGFNDVGVGMQLIAAQNIFVGRLAVCRMSTPTRRNRSPVRASRSIATKCTLARGRSQLEIIDLDGGVTAIGPSDQGVGPVTTRR
jgi:hypothetical protein